MSKVRVNLPGSSLLFRRLTMKGNYDDGIWINTIYGDWTKYLIDKHGMAMNRFEPESTIREIALQTDLHIKLPDRVEE